MKTHGASGPGPSNARPLRLLCVHGVREAECAEEFEAGWTAAVTEGLRHGRGTVKPEFTFLRYDALFAGRPRRFAEWRQAFETLLAARLWSATESGQDEWIRLLGGDCGGGPKDWFEHAREDLHWTAGMIARWVVEPGLKAAARRRLLAAIRQFEPQAVLAHGLGSLIAYDAFARVREDGPRLIEGRVFVSFASPINHPCLRDQFGGRLVAIPARHWFHLFNPHDCGFAAPIALPLERFTQVKTEFEIERGLAHDAVEYLRHSETERVVWRTLAEPARTSLAVEIAGARAAAPTQAGGPAPKPRSLREAIAVTVGTVRRTVARRALLVGISDYPRPEMRLEGCVNDVYLTSEILQELGFAAENIRIVLNDRATTRAIRDRLDWLLDGCNDGQGRVFYFSGHGAQIPGYGFREKVDRADECLVPHDFDWTPQHAILDNWFYELYSQLPPTARVLAVFDCCHSGGLARDGGARVRGLNPPDDIRHRILRWDETRQSWESRAETRPPGAPPTPREAVRVRPMFRRVRAAAAGKAPWCDPALFGHAGPFLPVILQACQERELAYEYRDGATAYGAFTWSLAQVFRSRPRPATWGALCKRVKDQLERLGYAQSPGLEGPPGCEGWQIPWKPQE